MYDNIIVEADKAGTGLRKVINSLTGALGDQITAQDKSAEGQAKLNEQVDEQAKKVQEAQDKLNQATADEKNSTKGKKGFAKQVKSANKELQKQQENLDKLQGKAQAAAGAQDMLSSLGISRDQLIDSNGHLKSMSDVMKVINDHTKDIKDVDVKNNIFNALFGTTGMQAGIILAQNNHELGELTDKVKKSADGQGYVATLAEKNMQSTKQQMNQLKSVSQEVTMTLGAAMLPAVNKAAKALKNAFNSKEGQTALKNTAKAIGEITDKAVDLFIFMGNHIQAIKVFGGILAGIWATKKIGDYISATKDAISYTKEALSVTKGSFDFGKGLFIKPKVDGSSAKRELGIIGKTVKGIGDSVKWTAKLAWSGVKKAFGAIKLLAKGVGKAVSWTAKLAWTGVKKALKGIVALAKNPDKYIKYVAKMAWTGVKSAFRGIITTAKSIPKLLKWTAKMAWSGVKKAFKGIVTAAKGVPKLLKWTAQMAWSGVKKAFNMIIISAKGVGRAVKWTAKVAVGGAKKSLAILLKSAKTTGAGMKAAFNWAKANPLFLIITGITLTVAAFTELYKHNKKFKKFIDGIVGGVQDLFKGVSKWMDKVWSSVKGVVNSITKIFKTDWKELLLLIVNPFAGAFALLYKHNDKFKKSVDSLIKAVVDLFKDMGKNISNIFNGIKDFITHTLDAIGKTWNKAWQSISDFFGDTWGGMKKFGSDAINSLKGTFDGVLDKIGKSFSDTWTGIKDGFSDMWDGMKKLAGDGINAVIKIPNAGIDGINGLIHDFGGPKEALGQIPKVKFASGTGAFSGERKPITKPTLALLNDGFDSPETGNKEALVHPNGNMEIVQGNNVNRWLAPGTEVLNAKELAMLMGATPFAKGTGFLGSIWDGIKGAGSWVGKTAGNVWNGAKDGVDKFTKMLGFITDAVAHPIETMKKTFNPEAKGMGNMFNGLGSGLFGKVKDQAKDWWSSLWNMANDSSNDGASAGNKGNDYPWKSVGKDSGADPWGYFYRECVSFVASRLKNMGVSTNLFSGLGNGSDWVNAKVSHTNNPKPGSVAVYGPGSEFGNHVAMVTGVQGDKFSGEEYNWNGDGNYHTYQGRSKKGATTFLDFGVGSPSGENKASDDKGGPLQGLIKSQVGGMFDWIKKFISPLTGGSSAGGGDVQSWSGDVKKALGELGLSTSSDMVQKVLRQIQTESGGNAKAVGGNDGLADGNATGLMQVKPGTFRANMLSGHSDIMNGYDNMLAGLNYAKKTYGSDLGFLGNGHGYANGGIITKHQVAQLGEGNQPEAVIPFDKMKSSRGFELLGQTVTAFAARDGLDANSGKNTSGNNVEIINELKNAVELLTQLVVGQRETQTANVVFDRDKFYQKQADDIGLRDVQSFM